MATEFCAYSNCCTSFLQGRLNGCLTNLITRLIATQGEFKGAAPAQPWECTSKASGTINTSDKKYPWRFCTSCGAPVTYWWCQTTFIFSQCIQSSRVPRILPFNKGLQCHHEVTFSVVSDPELGRFTLHYGNVNKHSGTHSVGPVLNCFGSYCNIFDTYNGLDQCVVH